MLMAKLQLLHTLNGSALALPRIVAAILENNQRGDKITIPESVTEIHWVWSYITSPALSKGGGDLRC